MESECQILDIKLAATSETRSFEIISVLEKIKDLEHGIQNCEEKIKLVHNAIALNILKTPENKEEIQRIYQPRLDYLDKKLKKKVCNSFTLCFAIFQLIVLNIYIDHKDLKL